MRLSGKGRPKGARRSAIAVIISAAMVGAILAVASPASATTVNVHCPGQDLQTKIDSAPAGATLLISGTCVGDFFLDKNLTLKGNPTATLDGDGAGRTLTIPNTHTVHLIGLTITGGLAAAGAGVFHNAGILTLNRVTVENNLAQGTSSAQAGGIDAGEVSLTLTASKVVHNWAVASGGAGATVEGAGILVNAPGNDVKLIGSTVSENRSVARPASGVAIARGGGLFLSQGTLDARDSHLDDNHVTASGPGQALADGGALDWSSAGTFSIEDSTLSGNLVTARTTGSADAGAGGGALEAALDVGTITGSSLADNQTTAISEMASSQISGGVIDSVPNTLTLLRSHVRGNRVTVSGATTADADGGGINVTGGLKLLSSSVSMTTVRADSGSAQATAIGGGIRQTGGPLTLSKSTLDQNHLIVSSSGANAVGLAGGLITGSAATIVASTISRNTVSATAVGAHTAQSSAAGLSPQGMNPQTIRNSTIASNVARAESDPATGTANALGGGLTTNSTSLRLTNTTVARNQVGAQAGTKTVQGGGIIRVGAGTTTLEATILALNTAPPAGGPNCSGPVASAGHNLLGTTSGCTFANQPTDQVNKDPKLGPLANNGGPTLTLALLTGSPALNVIPTPCAVTVDQRGIHRPQGPKCDIGSFERV